MNVEDLILISVDDHVVEPPTMFDAHLPARWKEHAPRLITKDDGSDVCLLVASGFEVRSRSGDLALQSGG